MTMTEPNVAAPDAFSFFAFPMILSFDCSHCSGCLLPFVSCCWLMIDDFIIVAASEQRLFK